MSYNDLVRELNDLTLKKSEIEDRKRILYNDNNNCLQEKEEFINKLEEQKALAKQEALQVEITKGIASLQGVRSNNLKVKDLNQEKRKSLLKKEEDKYEAIQDNDSDIKERKDKVIEALKEFYGDRLGIIVYNIVEPDKDENIDLDACWEKFDGIYEQLELIKKSFNINKFLDFVVHPNLDESRKYQTISFIIGLVVVLVLAYLYIFPLLAIFLLVLFCMTIVKTHLFISVVKDCKDIDVNTAVFLKSLQEEREREKMQMLRKINVRFDRKDEECDNKIAEIDRRISAKVDEITSLFSFNTAKFEEDKSIKEGEITSRINRIQTNILEVEQELSLVESALKDKANDIIKAKETLFDEYYNTGMVIADMNYLPPSDVLVDIKEEPIFMDLPAKSSVFFYDNIYEGYDFSKLFMSRIMNYMDPGFYRFMLIDIENMASYFTDMDLLNPDENLHAYIDDKMEMDRQFKDYKAVMKSRAKCISEYGDIQKYNDAMTELGSVPETYNFIFDFSSKLDYVKNQEYMQLFNNGYIFGLKYITFLPIKLLSSENSNEIGELRYMTDDFYYITEGEVRKLSKYFIEDRLSEEE